MLVKLARNIGGLDIAKLKISNDRSTLCEGATVDIEENAAKHLLQRGVASLVEKPAPAIVAPAVEPLKGVMPKKGE